MRITFVKCNVLVSFKSWCRAACEGGVNVAETRYKTVYIYIYQR